MDLGGGGKVTWSWVVEGAGSNHQAVYGRAQRHRRGEPHEKSKGQ